MTTPLEPSLGITVTETVRSGLRIIMVGVPCPTCGHPARERPLTLRDVAGPTGVSAATLSRFLSGAPITSDVLDRLYEWVNAHLPEPS